MAAINPSPTQHSTAFAACRTASSRPPDPLPGLDRHGCHDPEAHIVTGFGVGRTRIAETDNESHPLLFLLPLGVLCFFPFLLLYFRFASRRRSGFRANLLARFR